VGSSNVGVIRERRLKRRELVRAVKINIARASGVLRRRKKTSGDPAKDTTDEKTIDPSGPTGRK